MKRKVTPRGEGRQIADTGIRIIRNITVDSAQADALNAVQDRLQQLLGFRPNITQTLEWLIRNVQWSVVKMVIEETPK